MEHQPARDHAFSKEKELQFRFSTHMGWASSKPEALPDNKIMPTLNKGPGYHSPG